MDENQDNLDEEPTPKLDAAFLRMEPNTNHFLFKIRLRYWYTAFLIVIKVLVLVMIGSISTPRWSEQGRGGKKWRSGLLKCGGCQGKWEMNYLGDIVSDCDSNGIDGLSKTFTKLKNGGYFYVIFESFALAFALVWIVIIWCLLIQKRIFNDKVIYIIVNVVFLLHTIAVAGWFGLTEAKFEINCDKVSNYTTSYDVCPAHGPAMAIFIECFLFLLSGGFLLIFRYRKRSVNKDRFILR